MKEIAPVIYRHTDGHQMVCIVPGYGGSECVFRKCIERGNTVFGLERVPAIARLVQKGKTVRSTGYRDELRVAALPKRNAKECASLISNIFDTKTVAVPDYLNLTLTPSNPILHTTRLRTIFQDWHEGVVYESVPLFYEEWDDDSSRLLIACDEEVQEICRALPEFDLQYVKLLKIHYESQTVDAMTKKIASIAAFKGLATPTTRVDGGVVPDLHSRYFTADFSYGLRAIKLIAEFAGVKTPNIDETLSWYRGIAANAEEFRFSDYGITNRDEFVKFYLL